MKSCYKLPVCLAALVLTGGALPLYAEPAAPEYSQEELSTLMVRARAYDTEALVKLTELCAGESSPLSDSEAFEMMSMATGMGIIKAEVLLAVYYHYGKGTDKDTAEAKRLAKRVRESENAEAIALLDKLYSKAEAEQKATTQTEPVQKPEPGRDEPDLFGMSAVQVRELGVDFAEGRKGCPVDEQRAISLYLRAADMGDAKAQRWMGWRYRQGRGVAVNESKAREYFEKAARQGDKAAADALGMNPTSVSSDYVNTSGMSASQIRELGADFAEGRKGRPVNEQLAIQLYIKAADMGDSKAQRWMGWRYRQGRGVKKNESKAYYYFNLAANQGDQAAAEAIGRSASSGYINTSGMSAYQIRELGVDYAEGRKGRPVNEQMAIRLYIQAADMGDMKAQRWMGWRYRQGRGVPKNESNARYYFQRAANQGDKAAADALRM